MLLISLFHFCNCAESLKLIEERENRRLQNQSGSASNEIQFDANPQVPQLFPKKIVVKHPVAVEISIPLQFELKSQKAFSKSQNTVRDEDFRSEEPLVFLFPYIPPYSKRDPFPFEKNPPPYSFADHASEST